MSDIHVPVTLPDNAEWVMSVDFPDGTNQKYPGVTPSQYVEFIKNRRVDYNDSHWFLEGARVILYGQAKTVGALEPGVSQHLNFPGQLVFDPDSYGKG